MSHVAIIVGVSGKEFFLDRSGAITETVKEAKPFRSERAAEVAAQAHVDEVSRDYGPAVAKAMSYRVEARS